MGRSFSRFLRWDESRNDAFTFQNLPEVCKVRIFEFLSVSEKGVAAQVCKEWRRLLKSPVLWNRLDLTEFQLHSSNHLAPRHHHCHADCYKTYKAKMNSFHNFIVGIGPSVQLLRFAFDIGDVCDGWLEWIKLLLSKVRCRELTQAAMSWKQTAVKQTKEKPCLDEDAESIRLVRHRQRHFVGFFEYFVSLAPNITHLELEFDWSMRSVEALVKLRRLEKLVLRRYFAFQTLDQAFLDRLLDSLPCLEYLEMEVWTPNSTGLCIYSLKSIALQHLDVSESRGFYIAEYDLPKVRSIRIGHHPWNGPLVTVDCTPLPCLYHGLVRGVPNLREINGHLLRPDWKTNLDSQLNSVLDVVCPCHLHKVVPTSCVK